MVRSATRSTHTARTPASTPAWFPTPAKSWPAAGVLAQLVSEFLDHVVGPATYAPHVITADQSNTAPARTTVADYPAQVTLPAPPGRDPTSWWCGSAYAVVPGSAVPAELAKLADGRVVAPLGAHCRPGAPAVGLLLTVGGMDDAALPR